MTEKALKKLGFIKVKAKDVETNNGYDYYYYTLDLGTGLSLVEKVGKSYHGIFRT